MKLKLLVWSLVLVMVFLSYGIAQADPITDGGSWTCAGEGCPDNDDDDITNMDDDCPDMAGDEGARGCDGWTNADVDWDSRFQDNDYDRIINLYDKCPELPDLGRNYLEGFGCPLITEGGADERGEPVITDGGDWECVGCDDTDGDGIDDFDDLCADTSEDVEVDEDGCAIVIDGEGGAPSTSTETVSDEEIPDVPFYSSADEDEFDQEMVLDTDDTSSNLDETDAVESFNSESCSLVESSQAINYVTFILFGLTLVPLMINRKRK